MCVCGQNTYLIECVRLKNMHKQSQAQAIFNLIKKLQPSAVILKSNAICIRKKPSKKHFWDKYSFCFSTALHVCLRSGFVLKCVAAKGAEKGCAKGVKNERRKEQKVCARSTERRALWKPRPSKVLLQPEQFSLNTHRHTSRKRKKRTHRLDNFEQLQNKYVTYGLTLRTQTHSKRF